jgi:ABC-2 type transport system permease protein
MSLRRLRAILLRVIQETRRDRPSLALLFVAPLVITGLVTFIVRQSETPTVSAAVVSAGGAAGDAVATALEGALTSAGVTVADAADADAAQSAVEAGDVDVAILLPADIATGGATITVLTNGLDPAGEAAQLRVVAGAISTAAGGAGAGRLPTIEHATVYGTVSSDPIASFAPAIVGFFVYFFVYILTGVSFLRERTGGTLERLMATPVTKGEVVAGYTIGFCVFATIQVAILMTWALGTLHVPAIGPLPAFDIGLGIQVAGGPLVAYLVVLALAVGAVSLGIFLSTFARTELQVIQFIPIVLVPQFLLSGVLFPVSTLPSILQPFVKLMPLAYAVDGLRQVFIRGADLSVRALQVDLLVLVGAAVLFAVLASVTIRRDVV